MFGMKTVVPALVFGLACIGATTRSLAAPSFQAVDCGRAADQSTMNICAHQRFEVADAKLNAAYHALFAKIGPAGQTRLRSAQRAWLAYRDSQCAFETAGTIDGSIHPMMVSGCMEALTMEQTKRLDAQIHCQEGDLSCGGQ
jgi:uncharacterized protein YecT (DUF1311 family)